MLTTDAQVRKLMEEFSKHGKKGLAAIRAGMDRKTARKYLEAAKLPSELAKPRSWRTREDPFEEDWAEIAARLADAPELEAKALFEHLLEVKPGRYDVGQLRTFQRRVKQWRATEGPPKEVFFAQEHRPGEAMQTDFTWCNELEITIAGEPFAHMLCHAVLPYSNWEWATLAFSESIPALKHGVQAAVFRLGRVPEFHQTDHSTAATHNLPSGKRKFNVEYERLIHHLGMEPRTTAVRAKEQNGDVESLNGALKRRMRQHLRLRGSNDFDSVDAYVTWLESVLDRANQLRHKRLQEDLAAMRPLRVSRLPEYVEVQVGVTSWSTIRVKHNTYSVPSRLIGEQVRVRVYDDRIDVRYGGKTQLVTERLLGRGGRRIDYRHIIWSLVRKPGAFPRYKYRDELFPTLSFRRAYDALSDRYPERRADIDYLRILHLAASTMESEVETALQLLLDEDAIPTADAVKALVRPSMPEIPHQQIPDVDLAEYDAFLEAQEVSL